MDKEHPTAHAQRLNLSKPHIYKGPRSLLWLVTCTGEANKTWHQYDKALTFVRKLNEGL